MIKDKYTDMSISRQRKYQLRRKDAGLCMFCGKKAEQGGRCAEHIAKHKKDAEDFRKKNPTYHKEWVERSKSKASVL